MTDCKCIRGRGIGGTIRAADCPKHGDAAVTLCIKRRFGGEPAKVCYCRECRPVTRTELINEAIREFNAAHFDEWARWPILATDCDYEIVRRSGVQGMRLAQ